MLAKQEKGYKGLPMEGFIATWYDKNTGRNIAEFRRLAQELATQIVAGSHVLEVAPGLGYLAIELARLGKYKVTGLDISESFVRIATENAKKANVQVEFQHGNAAAMPFPPNAFDFIVCRAAFKNFSNPIQALNEMHRLLKPGGRALILDMRNDATDEAIEDEVKNLKLSRINFLITKWIFKHSLIKRAYSKEQFKDMASSSSFKTCDIKESPIRLEVSLQKKVV